MPAYTDYPQSGNIQGYWKLNEESGERADSGPNGNDLTDYSTVLYNSDFLAGTKCADFEASNSEYLSIADGSQTGLDIISDLTLGCWIKLESNGIWQVAIGKYVENTQESYNLLIRATDNKLWFIVSSDGTSGGRSSVIGGTVLSTGIWYYITAVFDNSANTLKIYLNGKEDASGVCTTAIFNGTAKFTIGSQDGSSYFDGEIAEVVVWNTCLTPAEVKEAMEVWRPV